MSKNHSIAIRMLAQLSDADLKRLAYEFAAKHPTSFLQSAGYSFESTDINVAGLGTISMELYNRLLNLVKSNFRMGNIITAIKEVRGVTNCGLKEAKDFCEYIRDRT